MDARGEKDTSHALHIWNGQTFTGRRRYSKWLSTWRTFGGKFWSLKKIKLGLRYGALVQNLSNKWVWLPDPRRRARLQGVVIPALDSQIQKKKQTLSLIGHVPAQCNTWGLIPEFVLWLPHAHADMYKRAYICVYVYLYTHKHMPHTYILTNSACSLTINLSADYCHPTYFLNGSPLVSFQNDSYWIWNSPC